ncbi:hypothetical protein FACS1894126_4300 [Alphaproteobacteria bacterium]|nr:hypothetical protein FACS1894126_4300 [Alphaproteobacteria bacterium]
MTINEYKDVLKQLFRGVIGNTLYMVNLLQDSPLAEITINKYLDQDSTSLQELKSNIICSCVDGLDKHIKEMKANLLAVMLVKARMMNGHFSYTSSCM